MSGQTLIADEILAWHRINALLQSYADAVDRGDIAAILNVFSADAVWDYRPGLSFHGRHEIGGFFAERLAVYERTSHHIGSPLVSAGGGRGEYRSTAYFSALHRLKDQSRYTVYGRYVDVVTVDDADTRIKSRRIIAHVLEDSDKAYYMLERVPAAADGAAHDVD